MSWWTEAGVDGALLAGALALAALGAGRLVWRRRVADPRRLLEQYALGCGLLGLFTLVEGWLGLFGRPLLALLAVLLIVGAVHLVRNRRALATLAPRNAWEALAGAVIVLLAVTTLLAALGPELEPDALSYHLPAAVTWASIGHDPFTPTNYPTGYPLLAEGVYAWLALLDRVEGARVLHWLTMLAAMLATAVFGARVGGRRTGILAMVILAGVPMLAWTAQTANTEGFGLLFFVLAVLRLDDHLCNGQRNDLVWAAVFLGLCASTKIWNLLFVPLFAAVVLAFWLRLWRQRRIRLLAAWRTAALFAGVTLAAYLPWALRSEWNTPSDPFYPLLSQLHNPDAHEFFGSISTYVAEHYGLGRGLRGLLLVGWNLTFVPQRFGDLAIGWLLLPLVTFGLFRVRHYPLLRLLLPIAGIAMLVWFFTSQQVRYLAPLFPVAAVLATIPVIAAAKKRAWHWLPTLVVVLALTGWAPLVRHQWPGAGFVPKVYASLLTGHATRDQIREQFAYNDEWSLWRFVNSTLPDCAKIRGQGASSQFWARRAFIDVSYWDRAFYRDYGYTIEPLMPPECEHWYYIAPVDSEWHITARPDEHYCRVYTNGSLVVDFGTNDPQPCLVPPLSKDEPFRWLEVAAPRDPNGYWWIGARARLMLAPGRQLEIVAPFAAQGANRLTVQVADQPPADFVIRGREVIAPVSSAGQIITLIAPVTVDPLALGYTGDPTPKSFLVRIVR